MKPPPKRFESSRSRIHHSRDTFSAFSPDRPGTYYPALAKLCPSRLLTIVAMRHETVCHLTSSLMIGHATTVLLEVYTQGCGSARFPSWPRRDEQPGPIDNSTSASSKPDTFTMTSSQHKSTIFVVHLCSWDKLRRRTMKTRCHSRHWGTLPRRIRSILPLRHRRNIVRNQIQMMCSNQRKGG